MIKKIVLCLTVAITFAAAQNKYPIVLVHGFMGWGPEEMIGYKYWGGFWSIESYLEEQGFTVYTVSVGPVSSNWERAIEIYHQLKGGQVDYGKAHADEYGIIQKPEGKIYDAMYQDWDAEHPVHLIGHSMGGQTIRMLDYLLENEFHLDSMNTLLEDSELLGKLRSGWIKSITTIATPHNGTTFLDVRLQTLPFIQKFIGLAAVIGSGFYNFDLQHWSLQQEADESLQEYHNRMKNHPAWESKNISIWDVSIAGAQELNTFLIANPDIYYFSIGSSATHLDKLQGYHLPNKGIGGTLRPKAKKIGREIVEFPDGTKTDSTWFENDGTVNTISMWGPTTGLNGADKITKYSESAALLPGQWYTFGPYKMDHYYIIGQAAMRKNARDKLYHMYKQHCELLYSLPQ